jgi:diguanylate cyclase (GGDEF)-like protein/PAS domain S-box-containing protein
LGLGGGVARLFMLAAMGRPTQVGRILLVEDDESFSILVRAYLRAMAADDKPPLATLPHHSGVPKLDWVDTLAAARGRLAERHYDLILLDLHLPDSQGIDTLRAIRAQGERIIIVMTADEDPELPKKALEHGAYDFVAKASMDQGELRRVVRLAILQSAAMSSLAASEARFRGLTHLIADVYWEQDEEYRFVSLNTRSVHEGHGVDASMLIGKPRWELDFVNMTPADWERHRAALEARRPFHDLELCRMIDGRQLWVSTSGEPVIDDQGRFHGYRGIGRDITSRKREEQLRALEQAVARALATAEKPAEALRSVIRAICETEHWPCGRFFGVDEAADVLRCVQVWGIGDTAVEAFMARSRDKIYRRGEGLTGAVWESGTPLWVSDTRQDARATGTSVGTGLEGGAFVFPVMAEGRTIGVLSFSSKDVRAPDERLIEVIGLIGSQVGQVLKRIAAEGAMRESEARFRSLTDLSADWYWEQDEEFRLTFMSRPLVERTGLNPAAYLGRRRWDQPALNLSAADWERHRAQLERHEAFRDFEMRRPAPDGGTRWLTISGEPVFDAEGRFRGYRGIGRDITERKCAEESRAAQARYQTKIAHFGEAALASRGAEELIEQAVRSVLEGLGGGVVAYLEPAGSGRQVVARCIDGLAGEARGNVVAYQPGEALAEVLGGAPARIAQLPYAWAGTRPAVLAPVAHEQGARGVLCALPEAHTPLGAEETRFLAAAASVLSAGLKRIDSEGRLAFLAQFDALTGLPNRALLADRFSQMIVQARRRGAQLGVLFVDLDEFKLVNDSLGHGAGDELLKDIARRLQAAVRSGDTVARIAGDEFAVVLADLTRPEDAAVVAQKLIESLVASVDVGGHEVFVTASIGIALFPNDGNDAEALLAAADAAMYRAKQAGRNSFQFYTPEINQRTKARAVLGRELRRALEREEFRLVYQPKFDLRTERPSGAEALLRWQHPARGVVSPAEFIPILEESGLIVQVGEWVLRRACADIRAWQASGARALPIAVNLSARQFRQLDLAARIRAIVDAAGVAPELVELEITESQLMQDPDHAIRAMRALAAAGIRSAIDDFGTGYSSLAYLTRFPLSALKIDRSFVAGILQQGGDATIVRTIIEMAHTLGLAVIAEGVENEGQKHFLRGLGCEQAQGFFFSRPVDADALAALLGAKPAPVRKVRV